LQVVQLPVDPALPEEGLVRAGLGDPAPVDDQDRVGVPDGRKAMGDDNVVRSFMTRPGDLDELDSESRSMSPVEMRMGGMSSPGDGQARWPLDNSLLSRSGVVARGRSVMKSCPGGPRPDDPLAIPRA
jgi:hypothetical protein